MMNKLLTLFTAATMIFAQLPAWAEGDFKTLDKYKADGSSVVVTLSGKTQYHAFKISNPPRLVMEFTNTEFNAPYKDVAVNGPVVTRIRGGQYQNLPVKLARIVVELNRMTDYELTGEDNKVRLIFNEPTASSESPAADKAVETALPAETVVSAPEAALPVETAVPAPEEIAVEQSVTGDAEKQVTVAEATEPAPVLTESTAQAPVIAEPVQNESLAIVPSPVVTETPIAVPVPTPAAAKPIELAQAAVSPEPETPKIEAQPAPIAAPTAKKLEPAAVSPSRSAAIVPSEPEPDKSFSLTTTLPRKPVSFDFEEADIKDVFRILSLKSGINIIYGSDVSGTLSLRLDNVPFDKAFQTILSLKNLVMRDEGNKILRVMTPAKVSEERAQAVTYSKIFPLNYAEAAEIKANLDSIRVAEGRRGNIAVDQRTNSLIVTDTPEGLLSSERMLIDLDKKPEQVVIEAKIVEIALNKSTDLGIQWQYAGNLKSDPNITVGRTKPTATDTISVGGPNGGNFIVKADEGGTGVNFPAVTPTAGSMSSFSFGVIANGNRLSGILTALAQQGHSKILSSPKITTINNKEAKILVGDKVPYFTQTVTNSGSTRGTQFLDVGIKLTVTPTINADRKISLQVHPEVSSLNEARSTADAPQIGTREALTTVIVNNGETAVIGGLITDNDSNTNASVPLLGNIPIIGHLFKRDYKSKNRTELLVFITPQIID